MKAGPAIAMSPACIVVLIILPIMLSQGHGHGHGGPGNNNKKPKAIPIPDMREVETHYRDYLPLFAAPLTYLHGKGEPAADMLGSSCSITHMRDIRRASAL